MNKLYSPIQVPFMFYYNKTEEIKSSPLTPYHRHNAYEVFLFLGGSRRMCIEDACYACHPGDLFVIGPNQLHAGFCDEACTYERLIVNVKQEFLEALSRDGVDFTACFEETAVPVRHIRLSPEECRKIKALYEAIEETGKQPEFGQNLLRETYIIQLFILINRWFGREENRRESENVMPQIVSEMMTYIKENAAEDISLGRLSKEFYFDSRYLSKLFKEYTGLTLRTYLMDCKMALAKQLLREGWSVSEVCQRSGFNDYANFLRSFKNYVGVSPGKYARQIKST